MINYYTNIIYININYYHLLPFNFHKVATRKLKKGLMQGSKSSNSRLSDFC